VTPICKLLAPSEAEVKVALVATYVNDPDNTSILLLFRDVKMLKVDVRYSLVGFWIWLKINKAVWPL